MGGMTQVMLPRFDAGQVLKTIAAHPAAVLPGGADHVRRGGRPPEGRRPRPHLHRVLHQRLGPPRSRAPAALRGGHRRPHGGGLRPQRGQPGDPLQPARGRAAPGVDRPPLPVHRRAHPRPRDADARGGARRAGRAARARAPGDGRLLGPARRDRRRAPRRLARDRRRRDHGRGRLLPDRRPPQGPHHRRRDSTSTRARSRRC